MGFNCGIVGLPNVGKSTLFNALTQTAAAEAANYPFCTIEPNTGRVGVPDDRLDKIAAIANSQKIIPTQLEFVDIAGLVKGASKGEGLGNQFLGNIRATDAIIHVLRCFENDDITHVDGSVDPVRDLMTIETELMLSDLESLEKRKVNLEKKARIKDGPDRDLLKVVEKVLETVRDGKPASKTDIGADEKDLFDSLQLLSSKPLMYVCNVAEDEVLSGNDHTQKVMDYAKDHNIPVALISAGIESEIAALEDEAERQDYLESLGLKEPGLNQVIRKGYELLKLITYFTAGPKEARAWTVERDATAPRAAGKIHGDFERGFICAETIAYQDYIDLEGEANCKVQGKLRQEGKDYVVQDGDIIHFRFNV